MLIKLDARDDKPTYLQIVDQVKFAAAAGRLRPGEALPSIRQLAERLRINRNTVDKAYRELDRQGVIETVRGRGAFLSEQESSYDDEYRRQVLRQAIDGVIAKARHLRVTGEQLLEMVARRLKAFADRDGDADDSQPGGK